MDAMKQLLNNATFFPIEKVYSGGFCYRARVDVKKLFAAHSDLPLVKIIDDPRFYQAILRMRRVHLFDICERLFGAEKDKWSSRIGKMKIQLYFKTKDDLELFSRYFSQSIDEVGYPASSAVLAMLSIPSTPKNEMIVYRPSLFFLQYRWRVTLVRRLKWQETDIDSLRFWINDEDDEYRLISEQEIDAKVYLKKDGDVDLLRFGFNNMIRKVEKAVLHSELI